MNTLQSPGPFKDVTIQEVLCDDVGAFLRRYIYNANNLIAAVDIDFAGFPYVVTGLVKTCDSVRYNREPLCFTDPVTHFKITVIRVRVYDQQTLLLEYWEDYEGNLIPTPANYDDLQYGQCEQIQASCELNMDVTKFCDPGNLDEPYIEVNITYGNSEYQPQQLTLDLATLANYPVIIPDVFCPGENGELTGTLIEFLIISQTIIENYIDPEFISWCPAITVTFNKLKYSYPSNQILEYYPHIDNMITETIVCADGVPAIKRTTVIGFDVTNEEFIGLDGSTFVPTTWFPGECNVIPTNCEVTITANTFCDAGNGGFQYSVYNIIYPNNAYPVQTFTLQGTTSILPYTVIGPSVTCPGGDGSYNPGEVAVQAQLFNLFNFLMNNDFKLSCPAFVATFGKLRVTHPSYEILDRLPHRTVSYTESPVCIELGLATNIPAIMRTEQSEYENEFTRTFYIDDGVPVTPISWTAGQCPDLIESCELNIVPELFCDPGNGDQEYYVFTFVYGNSSFPTFSITVDVGFSPYVPVTPNSLCAGSDGSLPGTIQDQIDASKTLIQAHVDPNFLSICPAIKVTFGKFSYQYPTNQLLERFPNINVSVTETLVCADGEPVIKRTTVDGLGVEFTEFLTVDGANVTPGTWIPGACADIQKGIDSGGGIVPDNTTTTILSSGTLRSVSIRITAGNATTLSIGGGVPFAMPNGSIFSWSAEGPNEYLDDNFVIDTTGAGTNTAIYTFTRNL